MKLGALKTAIRESEVAPRLEVLLDNGKRLTVVAQKTPLLASLDELYPEGRSQETELWLREDGFLMRESDRNQENEPQEKIV